MFQVSPTRDIFQLIFKAIIAFHRKFYSVSFLPQEASVLFQEVHNYAQLQGVSLPLPLEKALHMTKPLLIQDHAGKTFQVVLVANPLQLARRPPSPQFHEASIMLQVPEIML